MKKILLLNVITLLAVLPFSQVKSQETVKRNGYTLTFLNNYAELDPKLKTRLIETFFVVYPKLAKEYNPKTLKEVVFSVDTAYKGVAATAAGKVSFSSVWMKTHPEDIDVVTHEVMHIVQDYGRSVGPGWVTEGIADYARYQFGVDNAGASWSLPDLKPSHHYENSYRITARFFKYIDQKVKKGTIRAVDKSLRDHTYTADTWKQLTGKTIEELWADYQKNPAV